MTTVWVVSLVLPLLLLHGGSTTPLDDYVNRPDSSYKYELLQTVKRPGYTLYNINMTSQTWKPELQSLPVWWHFMQVVVPDVIRVKDTAFLYISGGKNRYHAPTTEEVGDDDDERIITYVAPGTVSAVLRQVPNQPMVFKNDPGQEERTEDGLIAWTWRMFVDNNGEDPEILARMPMTKAAVRAMDTVTDFVRNVTEFQVDRFVVAGASKRGWATWTAGAVDSRVIAISPVVMDLLDFSKNLRHIYQSLGGWPFNYYDYYRTGVLAYLDHPLTQKIVDIVDGISYSDRYATKPKYIISAGNDGFFFPDDTTFYLNRLKGETHLRMIPNADHGMNGHVSTLLCGLQAWYMSIVTGTPLPQMTWEMEHTSTGGKITVNVDTEPTAIDAWYATTLDGKMRDFRIYRLASLVPPKTAMQPVLWFPKCVQSLGNGTYSIEMQNPSVGWTAFFIEATFAGVAGTELQFSTETMIIPDAYPFQDCYGASCLGELV